MTRRRDEDHYGNAVRKPVVTDYGPLFSSEPAPEHATPDITPSPVVARREKAQRLRDARWARWIEAGRPVALMVAAQDGTVTAETFRLAAEQLPHVLPPTYGEDRTLSYLSAMFAELVADGHLRKRRRSDGSVVKVYSGEQRNEHVVYELCDESVRRSA